MGGRSICFQGQEAEWGTKRVRSWKSCTICGKVFNKLALGKGRKTSIGKSLLSKGKKDVRLNTILILISQRWNIPTSPISTLILPLYKSYLPFLYIYLFLFLWKKKRIYFSIFVFQWNFFYKSPHKYDINLQLITYILVIKDRLNGSGKMWWISKVKVRNIKNFSDARNEIIMKREHRFVT